MNQQLATFNRENLINKLEKDAVLVLFSGNAPKKSADTQYPFEVNRNFYYITGIDEPNLIVVLFKGESHLFIEEADAMYEKWVGKKIDEATAYEKSGIKNIHYLSTFHHWFEHEVEAKYLYLDLEEDQFNPYPTLAEQFEDEHHENFKIKDCYPLLAALRMVKSPAEIENIKQGIAITKEALENVMKNMRPGVKESCYEADFDYILKRYNVRHSFDSIVASGVNATVLHYVTNNEIAKDGDLVLFDLGATYNLYCADISRTFPTNGKYTPRQKELYNIVLTAHDKMIEAVKPGVTLADLNQVVIDYYTVALKEIGLINHPDEVSKYYYHNVSHLLGLDTHDIGGRKVTIQEGYVITCEPGLYIQEEGIGIRIEDDILVTKDGGVNLSSDIIRTVEEIEAFMGK